MYSSWCHVEDHGLLFDCGEGCATHFTNELFNITKILIGHSHSDHTLGLLSVIGARNNTRGMSRNDDTKHKNKPLTIYYPRDNEGDMKDIFVYCISHFKNWLRYDLKWIPIDVGFELQIDKDKYVRAFGMRHQMETDDNDVLISEPTTLGYVIYENRSKLKAEYVGKNISELVKSGVSKSDLMEIVRVNLFAYCLDAYEIFDPNQLSGCDKVVMDCTFLRSEDRTEPTHFSLDDSMTLCKTYGVKHMYAAHLSGRYDLSEVPLNEYYTLIDPSHVNII